MPPEQSERQRLEEAIAAQERLRGSVDDAVIDAVIATLREKLADLHPVHQQRKQLTVLFMDVVGSTTIVRDLDPEDNMAIMDTALQRLSEPVLNHGGSVTRYMGDGFKAIFGVPIARENDPIQSVRAGLAILAEARTYAREVEKTWGITGFTVRVGIHTGLVVLGGFSEAEDTIMGATVNLAARLESAAEPGTLLISQETSKHVLGVFDLQPMEPIAAKGFDRPVEVFRVLRAKPRAFYQPTRGVAGIATQMVGRADQLEKLKTFYLESQEKNEILVVTITGDAGVGKSRLVYEFEKWVDMQPQETWLFKSRAGQSTLRSPFALIQNMLRFRFDIQDDDPAHLVYAKLLLGIRRGLSGDEHLAMKAQYIGRLLGYPQAGTSAIAPIPDDPQQLRERAIHYLGEYFSGLSGQDPVLILLEDVHWSDESSLDAFNQIFRQLVERPVLVLCAARSSLFDQRPNWGQEGAFHRLIGLEPLNRPDTLHLLQDILHKVENLPFTFQETVVENADGNPFYLEELIKMLVDQGVIQTGPDRWFVLAERLHNLQIPQSLMGVLQARLDQLPGDEHLVLQQASVVGRIFWDGLLQHFQQNETLEKSGDDVSAVLGRLKNRELVFQRDKSVFAHTVEYIFKHDVLREVTYERVLLRTRGAYHGLAADWLISQVGDRVGEYAGLIAYHLEHAGKKLRAVPFLKQAGQQAAIKSAYEEALDYFNRGLSFAPASDLEMRFELLLGREEVFGLCGDRSGQAADLAALEELAETLNNPKSHAEIMLRQASYASDIGDFPKAVGIGQVAVELAEQVKDQGMEARGRQLWGHALSRSGEYRPAIAQLEAALDLARRAGDLRREGSVLNNLGPVASALGDYNQARDYYQRGLNLARKTGDRYLEGSALNNLGNVSWSCGDYPDAIKIYHQAQQISREIGDRQGEAITFINLGVIAADLGKYSQAEENHLKALDLAGKIGYRHLERVSLNNLGNVTHMQDDYSRAQTYYRQALALAVELGDRSGESFVLDGLSNTLVALGRIQDAIDFGKQAVRLREQLGQQLMAYESQCTLARALLAAERLQDALEQIKPVTAYLDEGGSLEGTSDPVQIYLTLVQVLQANGDERSANLLEVGYILLQERAQKISDPESRRSYLENVPWNQELADLYLAS